MTDFEQACNDLEKELPASAEFNENVIEWIRNMDRVTVTFSQKRFCSKIRKLAEQYPDECEIVVDDGSHVVAHFPLKWVKISNRKAREISDEEREALKERMRKAREKRFGIDAADTEDISEEELEEELESELDED